MGIKCSGEGQMKDKGWIPAFAGMTEFGGNDGCGVSGVPL